MKNRNIKKKYILNSNKNWPDLLKNDKQVGNLFTKISYTLFIIILRFSKKKKN